MSDKSIFDRIVSFFASLRLAVVVMLTLGSVCAFATFYEMQHGTPAAQRDIYMTPWFAFLLALLGVNVFSVMVSRWPWTKHQAGFLIAHVGILSILVGSVISLYRGLDSNMALAEGETSDRVRLLEKALHVSIPGLGAHGVFPVVFEKQAPTPERELRFEVPGTDLVLVADGYEPHVAISESFAAAEHRGPRAPLRPRRRPWRPRRRGWWPTTGSGATRTSAWCRWASTPPGAGAGGGASPARRGPEPPLVRPRPRRTALLRGHRRRRRAHLRASWSRASRWPPDGRASA